MQEIKTNNSIISIYIYEVEHSIPVKIKSYWSFVTREETQLASPVQWSWMMSMPIKAMELPTHLAIILPCYKVVGLQAT